jgi:acyl-coenzyme A thioesterase PaaI-like protein
MSDESESEYVRQQRERLVPKKETKADVWDQKRRLASALRVVIERVVPSDAPAIELSRAADALEQYAEQLKQHPRLQRRMGYPESANSGDVLAFFDQSPLIGLANPLAPPISLKVTGGDTVLGEVTFASAYEGPPGHVHGGFVAAAFDEVLGYVQSLSGAPGMTGTLTVRYRKPTPLHTPLRFEARYLRTEGRKVFTEAKLLAAGVLCAEAEGLFISMREGGMVEMDERREAAEAKRAQRGTE